MPAAAGSGLAGPVRSLHGEAWKRFRRHRLALIGAVVLALIILAVLAGPLVWRVPIDAIDFSAKLQGPSWAHPLGTDDLGQDLLARMLYGGRISIAVGFAAMVIAVVVGVVIGAIAGMSRGPVDWFLMWLTDLFLSLPQLPLLLLLIYLFRDTLKALVGTETGIFIMVVLVVGGFRWMPVARLVRAQFLSLREKEFVEASRSLGASDARIVFKEILPNLIVPIIVYATLILPTNILLEAALSFLGAGVQPPNASWGAMIAEATSVFDTAWWYMLVPGLALLFTVLAFNVVGDGLSDALNPRQEG